jgi:hypothetical protein
MVALMGAINRGAAALSTAKAALTGELPPAGSGEGLFVGGYLLYVFG